MWPMENSISPKPKQKTNPPCHSNGARRSSVFSPAWTSPRWSPASPLCGGTRPSRRLSKVKPSPGMKSPSVPAKQPPPSPKRPLAIRSKSSPNSPPVLQMKPKLLQRPFSIKPIKPSLPEAPRPPVSPT
ncbi:MAG: CxxxxCH/CxxCH domain-containing protein [bacterium]|nr:CxxxxCH/CxxCH domain-containing protein [bacterium]